MLALAIGGRGSHEPGESFLVVLRIAWPFAVAALVAHALLGWRASRPSSVWVSGVAVVLVTYAGGMALRAVSGRGLAPGFLVVAFLFLTATMLGWRLVAAVLRSRQARSAAPGIGG